MAARNDPERCDSCHTPLGVHKEKNKREFKRRVIDPISNKLLVMCNACGLRLNRAGCRPRNKKVPMKVPVIIEKEVCLKEFEVFTKALCKLLQDDSANKLYCPVLTPKLCQCIQRYLVLGMSNQDNGGQQLIQGNNFENINKEKAYELNCLHKRAKELIKMKAPKPVDRKLSVSEMRGVVKLRTKEYEQFVLFNRERLKKVCNLCERGVQRVLCYSNNYLHKQLKTSPNGEARIAGKSTVIAKLLPDISTLSEKMCCTRHCTRLALTHSRLIERWRNKALLGQRDARAVLAEMLTPAGGAVNCSTFLHLVTGCSSGLLSKVKKDMKVSAGVREPPEHGLREYWRRKKIRAARNHDNISNSNEKIRDDDNNAAGPLICNTVLGRSIVDSNPTVDKILQVRRSIISRTNSVSENFESVEQFSNKSSDTFAVGRNSGNCEQHDYTVNDDVMNSSSDTVIQTLFRDNINNDNYHEGNSVVSLPPTSSNSIDLNGNQNGSEHGNINRFDLIPSVLSSAVTNAVEESVTSSVQNVNENDGGDNRQHVQFIEITKLSSDTPASREETVPVESMIILCYPEWLLLNGSLMVTS